MVQTFSLRRHGKEKGGVAGSWKGRKWWRESVVCRGSKENPRERERWWPAVEDAVKESQAAKIK
jgi:hypothetical protein